MIVVEIYFKNKSHFKFENKFKNKNYFNKNK